MFNRSERNMLEEVAQSVRLAKEAISLAGSLAHSDPDDAWNVTLEASDHCSEALADLARIESGQIRLVDVDRVVLSSGHANDSAAVYRLNALLKRVARADDAIAPHEDAGRFGEIEGPSLSQAGIINHVADLCKVAVEEGMVAHSLTTSTEARDAAWASILASVEALYALLLVGAARPAGLNFGEGELDLAALHLVDEITTKVSSRVNVDRREAGANLIR